MCTQATLAESFLADLEDLSDNEVEDNDEGLEGMGQGELDGLDAHASLSYENLQVVATLVTTDRYNRIVKVPAPAAPSSKFATLTGFGLDIVPFR